MTYTNSLRHPRRFTTPLLRALAVVAIVLVTGCGLHGKTASGGVSQSAPALTTPAGGSSVSASAGTALTNLSEQLNSISNELSQAHSGYSSSEGDPAQ